MNVDLRNGEGIHGRLNYPSGLTVDRAVNLVLCENVQLPKKMKTKRGKKRDDAF